eukprot:CAMPEP_0170517414 /NCGR_PEP_ID=MMETSP0209-20121228/3417_1 /TAXON_ID=665100 ORGANISM="Litonotus pictus, Strain P1" /NCGR_SAMPLE_ID=MMETSP0209 /ASSEMBLY_ACC=CAM_ASM_000301 /LENGTH=426 /DNA_ID=CAMNT_0010802661 /DNA_START=1 /DNA_END=1281 /DNA_ORIENTATION=-
MKFFIVKLLLISLLIIAVTSKFDRSKLRSLSKAHSKSKSQARTHLKTTWWVRPLIKTAKSYHSFANLPYCPGDVINQLACPLCTDILDNSFEVYKFYKQKIDGYNFTFVLLYSTNRNELVITFAGPRSPDPVFYSTIYSRGFRQLPGHPDISIENTYMDVYQGRFQKKLFKYIKQYNQEFNIEEAKHKYIFVGHNFGGSLSTLAAFDMVAKKLVPVVSSLDSPMVYSYGALRIGNEVFVNQTNALFKVIRVVKNGDMYPRLPACTWSPSINKFRCEEEADYHRREHTTKPELYNYIQNYYGIRGGREASHSALYDGYRGASFLQKSEKSGTQSEGPAETGWSYGQSNPGYTVNNLGDPFDSIGRTNDGGKVTYSQPLGAEVLFSNNFKRHTICSYYYGIPNCEKGMAPEFSMDNGRDYFNSDLTDC